MGDGGGGIGGGALVLNRDRQSARAEEKATMSREKGLVFKKVFFYKKDPPIAL